MTADPFYRAAHEPGSDLGFTPGVVTLGVVLQTPAVTEVAVRIPNGIVVDLEAQDALFVWAGLSR